MCRIHNTTRRIRIHRASGNSAQNEAERTNSAIGIHIYKKDYLTCNLPFVRTCIFSATKKNVICLII